MDELLQQVRDLNIFTTVIPGIDNNNSVSCALWFGDLVTDSESMQTVIEEISERLRQINATFTPAITINGYWISGTIRRITNENDRFIPNIVQMRSDERTRNQIATQTAIRNEQAERERHEQYRRIVETPIIPRTRTPVPVAVDNQFIPAEAQRVRQGNISNSGFVQINHPQQKAIETAVETIRKFMNLPAELQGFLVEMCKHPIERDTILIFKDWLQQHGEHSLTLLTEEDVQKERDACVDIVDNTEVPYEVPYSSAGDITPEILKVLHDITKRIRARGNKGAKS